MFKQIERKIGHFLTAIYYEYAALQQQLHTLERKQSTTEIKYKHSEKKIEGLRNSLMIKLRPFRVWTTGIAPADLIWANKL